MIINEFIRRENNCEGYKGYAAHLMNLAVSVGLTYEVVYKNIKRLVAADCGVLIEDEILQDMYSEAVHRDGFQSTLSFEDYADLLDMCDNYVISEGTYYGSRRVYEVDFTSKNITIRQYWETVASAEHRNNPYKIICRKINEAWLF